jgi:hypothetical protein
MKFKLKALVSRSGDHTIRHALDQPAAEGGVEKAADDFMNEAEMEGTPQRT